MKILKWAVLIAVVVAVVAIGVHLRRDSIARGIANSVLSEQGLVVTDLSVDELTADRLDLSKLVIIGDTGARYEFFGLSMPLRPASTDVAKISADRLVVTYADTRDPQTLFSTTVQTVLHLPLIRPHLEAAVAEVSLPKLPELRNVLWSTSDQGQVLSFAVGSIDVTASIEAIDKQVPRLQVRATGGGDDAVLSADLELAKNDQKFTASGSLIVQMAAWLPVMRPLGLLPAGLAELDAELRGPIQIKFDDQAPGHLSLSTQAELVGELAATYKTASAATTNVRASSADQLAFDFHYPALDWIAHSNLANTIVDTGDLKNLPVRISDLECRSGIQCTMTAVIDTTDFKWLGYSAATANIALPLDIEIAESTRVGISAAARGTFESFRASGLTAESVQVVGFSGTELTVNDQGWSSHIDSLQLAVTDFSGIGKLVTAIPISFSDLDIRDSGRAVDAHISVSPGADATWDEVALYLPGAVGTISINDERYGSSLRINDQYDAVSAHLELTHDATQESGALLVRQAQVSFDRAALPDLIPGWSYPLDVVSGTWTANLRIEWRSKDADIEYSGEMTHRLQSLAGSYNDIAFVGLDTDLSAAFDVATGASISPSHLNIRLLDVGLPLENIVGDYAIDVDEQAAKISNLSMAVLGGEVAAEPFIYSPTATDNVVPLQARSIQLQLMVDIAEFENIEMSGAVSGELPMKMNGTNITIENGRLQSDAPGGVIHYGAGDTTIDTVAPDTDLSIVTRALNNFEFDSLSSDVDYTEAGDLNMQMRLSGINPDMDATQPIILNLSIQNNVPQLLRSLRAIRSIEDILEQRTAN